MLWRVINKERVPVIQLLAVWILCRNSFNKVDWYLETWNPDSSVMRGYSGSCGIQDRWLTRPRLSENILKSIQYLPVSELCCSYKPRRKENCGIFCLPFGRVFRLRYVKTNSILHQDPAVCTQTMRSRSRMLICGLVSLVSRVLLLS